VGVNPPAGSGVRLMRPSCDPTCDPAETCTVTATPSLQGRKGRIYALPFYPCPLFPFSFFHFQLMLKRYFMRPMRPYPHSPALLLQLPQGRMPGRMGSHGYTFMEIIRFPPTFFLSSLIPALLSGLVILNNSRDICCAFLGKFLSLLSTFIFMAWWQMMS